MYLSCALVGESHAIFIVSFRRDISVAVFLHIVSVALVVDIRAFKAFAVFSLFDGFAIAFAVFVVAFKAGAVGIVDDHLPVELSLGEVTFVDITVLFGQFSVSLLQVVFPCAFISVAVVPDKDALAVFVAF